MLKNRGYIGLSDIPPSENQLTLQVQALQVQVQVPRCPLQVQVQVPRCPSQVLQVQAQAASPTCCRRPKKDRRKEKQPQPKP